MHGRLIVVDNRSFEWIVAGSQQYRDLEDFHRDSRDGRFNGVVIWDLEESRKQYKAPLNEVVDTLRYPVLPSDVADWIKRHIIGAAE